MFDGSGTRCPVRMTDTACAACTPQQAAPATRSPVCFDVVACRRCAHRSYQFRLHRRHRVNRKARAMRRKPKQGKRDRRTLAVTRSGIGRNVSGTYPYSAGKAETRDWPYRASMPKRVSNEARRPSAHASRRCRQSRAAQWIDEALQGCDLAPGTSDANAQSRMARQGEYRCVCMHPVHQRINTRVEATAADRSVHRTARRSKEGYDSRGRRMTMSCFTTRLACNIVHTNEPLREASTITMY